MAAHSFADLIHHVGHEVVVVTYGDPPENVAIECEDCSVVLLDFDVDEEEDEFVDCCLRQASLH